jgi:hypothetical protein
MPAAADSFYEVWLIDPDSLNDPGGPRMAAVGTMGTRPGADFALPPSLDITRYTLVDVSQEPLDGDPTHSGKSLLRGSIG